LFQDCGRGRRADVGPNLPPAFITGAQPVRDYSAFIVVRGIGQRDRGLGAIGHGVLAFLNVCDNPRPAAKGKTIRAWLDCQRV
jgi:hypothetical protein